MSGKCISFFIFILLLFPIATEAEAHSPTPSIVKIIASLNGKVKALAA